MGGRQRTSLFMGMGESGSARETEKAESESREQARKGKKRK